MKEVNKELCLGLGFISVCLGILVFLMNFVSCDPAPQEPKSIYHFNINGREVRCHKFNTYTSGNALEDCTDGAKYFNVTNIRREQ